MLDFQQIKAQYPEKLQRFERAILREYLQYKILQAIFDSPHARKLSFLGGTALRIIHGNQRFSEDIDLDNFNLSWEEFEEVIQRVKRFMELEGYEVEIRNVAKEAYRCYLKVPSLLYAQGISPLQGEKILIQVDTTAQGYPYKPETVLINKFDVFTHVKVTPLNILLSQKIFTAINRKRPKGRDFFDITFLSGLTKPDMGFLSKKLGVNTAETVKKEVSTRIAAFNFKKLAEDVSPFVISQEDIQRVEKFQEFWEQVKLE